MKSGTLPPGASSTSSATPLHTIIVARVQAIDCRRMNATRKPLMAPTSRPTAITISSIPAAPPGPPEAWVAVSASASEMTPATERSKPRISTTSVPPAAASASGKPLLS